MNNFLNIIVILISLNLFHKLITSDSHLDEKYPLSYYNELFPYLQSGYLVNYQKCEYNCLGIEMEIEFLSRYPKINSWNNFLKKKAFENNTWYDILLLKYDYSIPYGIELNFQPMYFNQVWKIKWDNFFEFLKEQNPDINLDTGLHLHISARDNDIFKIATVLIKNKDYFVKFMQRENKVYARYCSPNVNIKKCISRLSVINYNSIINTIEIRGFKTTLDTNTFLEYISFMEKLDKFYKKN